MTTTSVRLPVEPLLKMSGMSLNEFALVAKTTTTKLNEYRRHGGFTPSMADLMATRFHLTPGYVWPDLWWSLPEGSCGSVLTKEEKRQQDNERRKAQRRIERAAQTRGMAA